jgi:uncharacterized membrane protein
VQTIHASTHIAVPVAEAFSFAADYRNATILVSGLQSFEPVGKKTRGKGAKFAAVIEIAKKHYESVLAVTIYDKNKAIGWEAVKGGGHSLVWRFEPAGHDATDVDFELGYEPPGGVAGALVRFSLESMLRSKARSTAAALKRELEK